MEQNFEGLGVGGEDDELGNTTVEGLGSCKDQFNANSRFTQRGTDLR